MREEMYPHDTRIDAPQREGCTCRALYRGAAGVLRLVKAAHFEGNRICLFKKDDEEGLVYMTCGPDEGCHTEAIDQGACITYSVHSTIEEAEADYEVREEELLSMRIAEEVAL